MATEDFDRKVNDLIAQIERETAESDGTVECESRLEDLKFELTSLIFDGMEAEDNDRLEALLMPTAEELSELDYLGGGDNG
jgi:hypothetical protein